MAITISGSGITSANIADGTIVNADINSSAAIAQSKTAAVTSSDMPVGSIVQVVNVDGTTETSTTGTSWTSTAASLTITPKFSNSKIYLHHTAGGLYNSVSGYGDIGLRIKRVIGAATTYPYQSGRYHYSSAQDWTGTNWAVVAVDATAGTIAATYTIEIHKQNAAGEIRHCDTATWTFVAMEIVV